MSYGHNNYLHENCDLVSSNEDFSEDESQSSYDRGGCDEESMNNYSQRPFAISESMSKLFIQGDQMIFGGMRNQQLENSNSSFHGYAHRGKPHSQIFQPDVIVNARKKSMARYLELKAIIEDLIQSNEVVIFSKTYCPYCDDAKDIFDDLDQPYTVLELDKRTDGEIIQGIMEKITGGRSVPRIFINGVFIGGGDDIKQMYESGQLEDMLGFG